MASRRKSILKRDARLRNEIENRLDGDETNPYRLRSFGYFVLQNATQNPERRKGRGSRTDEKVRRTTNGIKVYRQRIQPLGEVHRGEENSTTSVPEFSLIRAVFRRRYGDGWGWRVRREKGILYTDAPTFRIRRGCVDERTRRRLRPLNP